nr:hypothetical protein [Flavobacteriaceae bacterium]
IKANTETFISLYEFWLWKITEYVLRGQAEFTENNYSFKINKSDTEYTLNKKDEKRKHYRLGLKLAQDVITQAKKEETPETCIEFNYSNDKKNYHDLEQLQSKEGFLKVSKLSFTSEAEQTDEIVFTCCTDKNEVLTDEMARFLLRLNAKESNEKTNLDYSKIEKYFEKQRQKHLDFKAQSDLRLLQFETYKFEKWADDKITSAELEIKAVKKQIAEINRELKAENITADKMLELQQKKSKFERKKSKLRRNIDDVEEDIWKQRDEMIVEAKQKINRTITEEDLFTIRWKLV